MKNRVFSLLLALALLLSLTVVPAAAQGKDLVITKDTLLKQSGYFVMYNSITVKSGATLTIDKDNGFEIAHSLTVEPGARLICNGVGSAQFQFSMRYDGATVTGVDLYYPEKWGDGSITYEKIPTPFVSDWSQGIFSEEQRPQFKWNTDCCEGGGWCITWAMSGNPFGLTFDKTEGDLVITKDTLLKPMSRPVVYDSVTVKAGAALTLDKNCSFEIARSLTVEPGAKLVSNGVGEAQYQFSMKNDGAAVTGVDLYYPQRWDNGTVTYEEIPTPLVCDWSQGPFSEGSRPQFKWDPNCGEAGGWCLSWSMGGNPFNIKFYHMEREMETAQRAAQELKRLDLFRGVGNNPDGTPNFDLGRKATRAEGLAMFVRMLGKEDEAKAGKWEIPFSDVDADSWMAPYVGYAWAHHFTKGKGDGTFGATDIITAQQYMTFLLRALEYDDSDNQLYKNALALAGELDLLVDESDSPYEVCIKNFWRADMVVASLRCLRRQTAGGEQLAAKLGIQL